jgi:hypothetical protein
MLQWDSSATATAYKVYRSAGTGEFRVIVILPMTQAFDWAVEPGHVYRYTVTATNEHGESGPGDTVKFSLMFPPPPPVHGAAQGVVTDATTGDPLEGAVVQFFKPGFELHSATVYTDSSGAYSVRLDTGAHLVRFMKFGYKPEWYDNAERIVDATPVRILADDTTFADAGLNSLPPLHPISISGTVRDTLTGLPLPGSHVAVLRPLRGLRLLQAITRLFGGFPSEKLELPGLGCLHGVVRLVRADSTGRYEVVLPGGGRFIALAYHPGYIHKFFNNRLTAFDADRIELTGDTTGIDFDLLPNPAGVNELAGRVRDSSGAGVPAHVVLMRLTSRGPRPVRFTMTDSVGGYLFTHLVAGKFFVRAYPVDAFAPAWFSAMDCGVRNWHNADTVIVSGPVNGMDVCVEPLGGDGYCRITGRVVESGGMVLTVSPSMGASVYAVSSTDGHVAGYDVTEDDGSYVIENLEPGTYQIVTDKEGFTGSPSAPVPVGGIANADIDEGEIALTADAPVADAPDVAGAPVKFALRQNYPNPFNPTTEISFEIPVNSSASLKVYNLIGQEINLLTYGTFAPGEYKVRWTGVDGNGAPAGSGVYFVKLLAVPVSGGEKFSQVIKVILLK